MRELTLFALGFLAGWLFRRLQTARSEAEMRRLTRSLHESEKGLRAAQEAADRKGEPR
jgi:uncharacterized membrane protein YciS (DUF1049 family)